MAQTIQTQWQTVKALIRLLLWVEKSDMGLHNLLRLELLKVQSFRLFSCIWFYIFNLLKVHVWQDILISRQSWFQCKIFISLFLILYGTLSVFSKVKSQLIVCGSLKKIRDNFTTVGWTFHDSNSSSSVYGSGDIKNVSLQRHVYVFNFWEQEYIFSL